MTPKDSRLKTLILTLEYPHRTSYYDDWFDAFCINKKFWVESRNILDHSAKNLATEIDSFDAIILLHGCTADTTTELSRFAHTLASRNRAKLFAFVGNEFNSPYAPLADKIAVLSACRADVIATQMLEEAGRFLYEDGAEQTISIPHALNPNAFRPGPKLANRNIDIGVRSFRYSPLLGDNDRNRLLDYFSDHQNFLGLTVDISQSQSQRFGREDWAVFLASCRATISTEAGSWYLERDDQLVRLIHDEIGRERTGLVLTERSPLRRIVRRLPSSMKAMLAKLMRKGPIKYGAFEDEKLDFEEVYNRFFKNAAKCTAYSKAISSRHFDAIGTKTCQIMFPGRYNDILTADEHYLALQDDFSNIEEVVRRLREVSEIQRMVDRTYDYVMSAHTHEHRTNAIYDVLTSG